VVRRGHSPLRTCVLCRTKGDKWGLLRLALDDDRAIVVDRRQLLKGRGAYVCPSCLPRLRLDGRLQRAFRNRARALNLENLPADSSERAHENGVH
jgi:hypothetical protein